VLTLQRALAADPLNESAHRALMRVFADLGRRQEALAQYHRLRSSLRRELEADPDEETRRLYRELLAVPHPERAEHVPQALPVQLTSFVGRERELAEVLELLERVRLLTLTGPGGSGKTRLALAAAERAAERYPDGVWFVELGGISEPTLVAEATATAVGIRVPARRTAAEAVAEHLAGSRALLFLDTCEHVIGACAALADTVLRVSPGVAVLTTSREALRSSGETAWRVPGLETDAAVELFSARARDAAPSFDLTPRNEADVRTVCERLDGMPLAIELAAARSSALEPGQIAARLADSLDVLSAGSRTALTRQQTLRATIDWSHDLLTGEERVLFRRLAVFAGSFTLEAAEEVCVGGAIEQRLVVDLLARLVDKSLVVVEDGARYRLLDTIRQFGAERLHDAGERDTLELRLLSWAQGFAAEHHSLARIELDHDNIRAALDAGLRHDPQGAMRLVANVWRFWLDRNYFTEGVRRVAAVLEAAPETTELRGQTLLAAAALELRCGERASFVERAREAEADARRSANPPFAADVLHRAAALYLMGLTLDDCRRPFADALALAETAPGRASVLHASSLVRFAVGEYDAARELLRETLAELRTVPEATPPFFEGLTYGFAVLPEGPHGQLRPVFEETIMLFHRFARPQAEAYTLCNLAVLERCDGLQDESRAALDEALAGFRRLGDEAGEAFALAGLGNWARTFGDPDAARVWLEASLELRRGHGDRRAVSMTETDLALALARGDELEPARTLFREIHDRFTAADDAPGAGGVLLTWGLAEECAGESKRAAELFSAGAEAWERHLGGQLLGWPWLAAADAYLAIGDDESAQASVEHAERILTAAGDRRGTTACRTHPAAAKPAQRSRKGPRN
jgi:predicted ATPase